MATTQQKKKRLRNKADKTIQELGRKVYSECIVCGKPLSCLHHYYPKSTCSALRYDWENLIPLCAGCHFGHHNGNPEIHNKVNEIKGKEWLEELRAKKRNLLVKHTLEYYKNVIKTFSTLDINSKIPYN